MLTVIQAGRKWRLCRGRQYGIHRGFSSEHTGYLLRTKGGAEVAEEQRRDVRGNP